MDSWIETSGCRLSVRVWEGERVPLVLLHGAGSNLEEWASIAPQLAALGFKVATYDARCHGLSSDAEDLDFEAQARDLGAVIADLALDNPIIVGASMGAMVGLEYLANHVEVAGLVSIDGSIADLGDRIAAGQPLPDYEALERLITGAHFDGDEAGFEAALPTMLAQTPLIGEAVRQRQHPIVNGRVVRRPRPEELIQLYRNAHQHLPTPILRDIRRPVLFVLASRPEPDDDDGWARIEARRMVAARISNPLVQVQWVPTGHQVAAEDPELVIELLRDFAQLVEDGIEEGPSTDR